MAKKKNVLVYSTEHGRMCPGCNKAKDSCICNKQKSIQPTDGIVRVGRQTKGRKGKGVTTISGVPLEPSALLVLCKELKKKCGTGGTVKDGVIEIQGDHRDALIIELEKRGWQVKRAGG